MIYFSADWHLGHTNIIRYCDRPFSSSEEMDDCIMSNTNSIMTDKDELYLLGDFTLLGTNVAIDYISRLNIKRIYIIPGSHDVRFLGKKSERAAYVEQQTQGKAKILPALLTLRHEGQRIVLCHYSMRSWDGSHHGSWHLHGHSHCKLPPHGRSMDVGTDCHGFKPVSFEQVKKVIEERE